MAIMDRSTAFRNAKEELGIAKNALGNIQGDLAAIDGYNQQQILQRQKNDVLKELRRTFIAAGVLAQDASNDTFKDCQNTWYKSLPIGEIRSSVSTMMDRLGHLQRLIGRSIKSSDRAKIQSLKVDLVKARHAVNVAQRVFDTLVRERREQWQTRQAERAARSDQAEAYAESGAPKMVQGILARIENPGHNRGKRKRKKSASQPESSGRRQKDDDKGTSAERRKALRYQTGE
jgi:hypothetical protein